MSLGQAPMLDTPTAEMLTQAPKLEKGAHTSDASTAPTVKPGPARAGLLVHALTASLPAASTHTMPPAHARPGRESTVEEMPPPPLKLMTDRRPVLLAVVRM